MIRILRLEQRIMQKMSFECRKYCPLLSNRQYVWILEKEIHVLNNQCFGGNEKNGQQFHCLLGSSIAIYLSLHVRYLLLVIYHPLFCHQYSGFQFNQICMHDVHKSQKDILVQNARISFGQNCLTRSKYVRIYDFCTW